MFRCYRSLLLSIVFILCLITNNTYAENRLQDVNEYHLMVLGDIHLGAKQKMDTAPAKAHSDNDLDLKTFTALLSDIDQLISLKTISPNSLLVMGDSVDHFDGDRQTGTPSGRESQLRLTFSILLPTFKMPISYVFGNNDSLLGDYQQYFDIESTGHSAYEIAKNAGWSGGFSSISNDCQSTDVTFPCLNKNTESQMDGYYSEYLAKGLKLVVLNSVLFEASHPDTYHGNYYNGELNWFNKELADASKNRDSVLIAMHVPLGINLYNKTSFWEQDAYDDFTTTLNQYANEVIGILVAHTHNEEIRLFKDKNNHVIPIIFTAGLSTSHGNAPSFKYLTIHRDQNSKWILDSYKTYYYTNNQFNFLYDFTSTYCNGLSTIANCLDDYLTQKKLSSLLTIMNQFYTAGNPNNHSGAHDTDANDLIVN